MIWWQIASWINLVLMILAIVGLTNAQAANFRTHTDIIRLLSITMRRHQTGGAILTAFDTVSYQRHMNARFFFRDPWKLYPQIVRDAVANPDVKEEVPVEVKFGLVAVGPPPDQEGPTIQ